VDHPVCHRGQKHKDLFLQVGGWTQADDLTMKKKIIIAKSREVYTG
jgi:hypothetical protein